MQNEIEFFKMMLIKSKDLNHLNVVLNNSIQWKKQSDRERERGRERERERGVDIDVFGL